MPKKKKKELANYSSITSRFNSDIFYLLIGGPLSGKIENSPPSVVYCMTVALTQAVVFLCELRGGSPMHDQYGQRRVTNDLTFLETLL
jgi:hypothetical protein